MRNLRPIEMMRCAWGHPARLPRGHLVSAPSTAPSSSYPDAQLRSSPFAITFSEPQMSISCNPLLPKLVWAVTLLVGHLGPCLYWAGFRSFSVTPEGTPWGQDRCLLESQHQALKMTQQREPPLHGRWSRPGERGKARLPGARGLQSDLPA